MYNGALALWGSPGDTRDITGAASPQTLSDYGLDFKLGDNYPVAVHISVATADAVFRFGVSSTGHVIASGSDIRLTIPYVGLLNLQLGGSGAAITITPYY